MRPVERPPTAGIVAATAYVLVVLAPYLFLEAETVVVDIYYDAGVAGPQFLSLLALVAVVLFAAGRQERTEPDFAAGLTLVLGAVLTAFVLVWALAVPTDVVLEAGDETWFRYHRWLVLATAATIALVSAWYARVLGLL